MAVSGACLFAFICGHLAGNLLIFLGPNAINAYAEKLHHLGPLLWLIRFALLTIVGLHILTAVQITLENRKARPEKYQVEATPTSYAARTMMMSGLIVLGYLLFHLLHFTFKVTHPHISHFHDMLGREDVYSMVVLSFKDPLLCLVYIASTGLLCLHLSHGISSLLQTLGAGSEKNIRCFKTLGGILALLIFLGYSSIPTASFWGCLEVSTPHSAEAP